MFSILLLVGIFEVFSLIDCLPATKMLQKRSVFDILPNVKTEYDIFRNNTSEDNNIIPKYKSKINLLRNIVRKLINKENKNKSNYHLKTNMKKVLGTINAQNFHRLLTSI